MRFLYSYPEQCTVLCLENNREYACNTSSLSTDSRDYVTQDDLKPGNDLIWVYKGTRYSVHFKHFKGILLCILPPVGVRKVLVLIQEMQTPDLKHLTKTVHLIMVVMTMRYAMKFYYSIIEHDFYQVLCSNSYTINMIIGMWKRKRKGESIQEETSK